jgi:putative transposase
LVQRKLSLRRACALLGISRRWLGQGGRREEGEILPMLLDLAQRHPRYGYRMLHQMLRRELAQRGDPRKVNVKKVRRLCREHGLTLSRRRRKKRRGMGTRVPCRAAHPNHVRAYDFVFDACADGRALKILTVEDEFTRQGLALEVEHRISAKFVARTLSRLWAEHGAGAPTFVRSDNGPEFIARELREIPTARGVVCRHIDPGSPWQNGRNERFNGTLRNECLNLETFAHRDQARAICRLYLREYNTRRPHSSLGHLTPDEFAARQTKEDLIT